MLAFAVADGRVTRNVAAMVKPPKAGRARREGQFLALEELEALAIACNGPYADVVRVLGLCGLRWGELAGLQVGDRVKVPGEGLRLQRTVLASSSKGGLYVWSAGKAPSDWLFSAPGGGPLSESNWKRAVGWREACAAIGRPTLRAHDLRHTAASIWPGVRAQTRRWSSASWGTLRPP